MSAFTDEQREFLTTHRQAVLATGRRDGSPQLSTVVYTVVGDDVIVSTKRYTAKWKNALRQPRVALLVGEGHKQLVVYGTATGIADDPARAELTAKVFEMMSGQAVVPEAIVPALDAQQRTVLRIRPDAALMND
jgi:PPOX class probable F420-dependent enzyme